MGMKRRLLGFLLMSGLMLHYVCPISAQQTDPIGQAKQQIRLLEAVEKDPTASPEAKSLNQRFLRERRLQLQVLLTKAIAGLRDYQARVRSSLTGDENEVVENSIRSFEKSLQELNDTLQASNSSGFPANEITAVASASTGRSLPPTVSRENVAQVQRSAQSESVSESTQASNTTTAKLATDSSAIAAVTQATDCDVPIPRGGSTCYLNVPKIIECDVDRLARQASDPGADVATIVEGQFDLLFSETVIDAFSNSNTVNIRQLTPYQYIGETARTDKQIGSPASSKGSTSAAEKPGWADILGFAVEHGAIQQAVSGTTLTLSTTPYAFFVPTENDTAAAYAKYGNYRRVALSATFNISNQDSPLSNARRQSLSNYSVKVRLSPDRSPRSQAFQDQWASDIKPTIQKDVALISGIIQTMLKQPGGHKYVDDILDGTPGSRGLIDEVTDIASSTTKTIPQKQIEIKNKILCALDNRVFQQTKEDGTGLVKIDATTRRRILDEFLPALFEAQEERLRASKLVQKIFDDMDKKWMGTLAYTNNRAATGSNYSEVKFLFQNYIGQSPVKVVANAGLSFYNRPDPVLHQQRLRDFSAAFSLEGKRKSPFIKDELDQSQMTFSLTGRYERLRENQGMAMRTPDIGIAQFKLDLPIGQGMSIPLSLTYANATELQKEQHVRGNFGFTLDADKFLILRRLLQH
jgi:hypothetical protein